ncbi:facilitated trehalose transporter Tret1 isoform X2 [Hydra vulgaris]|uniref:Facilitated trehalose transporter Tret1 isoform X2 n=1 Tax=Hydra vulgaris TaxID=6087 RepID=A0ABM4BPN0_HYDVU
MVNSKSSTANDSVFTNLIQWTSLKSGIVKRDISNYFSISYSLSQSLLGLGALAGLFLGLFCVEHSGRKNGVLIAVLIYTPGWISIGYFSNKTIIYVGRILTGVACGFCSLTVPIYIAEVSSFQFRGRLEVINQIGITIGIFLAFLVGSYCNFKQSATAALIIALAMGILILYIPDSPRWLLAKKKRYEANKALKWLRGNLYNVEDELNNIENNLEQLPMAALNGFRTPGFCRALLYGSTLMFLQQMSGINAMMFFGQKLFQMTRMGKIPLVLYLLQVLITITACFLIDKCGMRKLLMLGAFGMFFCNLLLGVCFEIFIIPVNNKTLENHFDNNDKNMLEFSNTIFHDSYSWLVFTCFLLFIASYSIGWGAIPYLLMSEKSPPHMRSLLCALVLGVNWLFTFLVTFSFNILINLVKIQGALWFFSVWCFISIIFAYYFV